MISQKTRNATREQRSDHALLERAKMAIGALPTLSERAVIESYIANLRAERAGLAAKYKDMPQVGAMLRVLDLEINGTSMYLSKVIIRGLEGR